MINDEGDIVVPVDPRYLGLWLTGLFGDPDTTDNLDGSWDHEFASGGDDLPSYTIEVVTYEVLCQGLEGVLRGVGETRKMEHPRCRKLRRSRAYQARFE